MNRRLRNRMKRKAKRKRFRNELTLEDFCGVFKSDMRRMKAWMKSRSTS